MTTEQSDGSETTRPPAPGEVVEPSCDDDSDCAYGFQLDGNWFAIGCLPLRPASVSPEEIGAGIVSQTSVSVNTMREVGPDVLVAMLAPASLCGTEEDGGEAMWTAAEAGDADPEQVARAICKFGDLTTSQRNDFICDQRIPDAPSLNDETIERATEFMNGFLTQLRLEDAGSARSMWANEFYGGSVEEAEEQWAVFLATYAWLASPDVQVEFSVVPSWGFTEAHPIVVVVAEDSAALTSTFMLSQYMESEALRILRLPRPLQRAEEDTAESWIVPPPGSTLEPGPTITFPLIPVEGGARAFVAGREIVDVYVDHDALTTTVVLPSDITGEVVLTLTLATPEVPTALSATFLITE